MGCSLTGTAGLRQELIAEVPPIPVNGARISCDGGPSPERGHPIVYINLDGEKPKCVPLPFTAFNSLRYLAACQSRRPVAPACAAGLPSCSFAPKLKSFSSEGRVCTVDFATTMQSTSTERQQCGNERPACLSQNGVLFC